MPLINTFLWVTLILVILLSFQLVYSYHRAEQEILRKAVRTRINIRCTNHQSTDYAGFRKQPGVSSFMSVGQQTVSADSSTISYYLPGAQPTAANQQSKMAAAADCQSCA